MADPYISELKYRGPGTSDFIEIAVDAGSSVANLKAVSYNPDGSLRSSNEVTEYAGTIAGKDIYIVRAAVHKNGAVSLIDDGNVLTLISFDSVVTIKPGQGEASGMTSTQIGSTGNDFVSSLASTGDGVYTIQTPDEGVIPCFLRGTRIACATGLKCVEDLEPGDQVQTQDGHLATLRWVGFVNVRARGGALDLTPVKISRGALGQNRPMRDMWVSPNHRILLNAPEFEMYFDAAEVLIPAKHLVGWRGIHVDQTVPRIDYFHLLFDQHEIILSEGLYTESLHPAEAVLDGMQADALDELYTLFPNLRDGGADYGKTARRCLKSYEVGILKQLHA